VRVPLSAHRSARTRESLFVFPADIKAIALKAPKAQEASALFTSERSPQRVIRERTASDESCAFPLFNYIRSRLDPASAMSGHDYALFVRQ